jgi:hypothetical protein
MDENFITHVCLDEAWKTCNPLLNAQKLVTYVYLDEVDGGKKHVTLFSMDGNS